MINCNKTIDLSGLSCPLPILRTKKTLSEMSHGEVLEVITTDPGAPHDFEAFCRQTSNILLTSDSTLEGKYRLVIKRK